jgi:phytanoyl-CoA hydroxylase
VTVLVPGALTRDLEEPLRLFAEHGFARLGPVLDDDGLASLRERADQIMLGEVVYPGLFFQRDTESGRYDDLTYGRGWEGPSLNYRKIEKLEKDPRYRAFIENALFERVARALIDGEVAIYRAVLFNKASTGGTVLPWHQDGGRFWGLDRDPTLQIWTALDDCTEESGCLEVLPGSHERGLATPLGGLVPADRVEERGADGAGVLVPARAGESLLVHNHLWHRSAHNRSGRPRRAFTVCYMTAATRCLRKKRAPREFTRVWKA